MRWIALSWVLSGCVLYASDWGNNTDTATVDGDRIYCSTSSDCADAQACVTGRCEWACTADEDCEGAYACQTPEASYTDALGCVERCSTDWDCKAGTRCGSDGSCS